MLDRIVQPFVLYEILADAILFGGGGSGGVAVYTSEGGVGDDENEDCAQRQCKRDQELRRARRGLRSLLLSGGIGHLPEDSNSARRRHPPWIDAVRV